MVTSESFYPASATIRGQYSIAPATTIINGHPKTYHTIVNVSHQPKNHWKLLRFHEKEKQQPLFETRKFREAWLGEPYLAISHKMKKENERKLSIFLFHMLKIQYFLSPYLQRKKNLNKNKTRKKAILKSWRFHPCTWTNLEEKKKESPSFTICGIERKDTQIEFSFNMLYINTKFFLWVLLS